VQRLDEVGAALELDIGTVLRLDGAAPPSGPSSSCEFCHSSGFSVVEATYLVALLSGAAAGSSLWGQWVAKNS
jgi:hypothetical protein